MTFFQKSKIGAFIFMRRTVYLLFGLSRFLPTHREQGVAVFSYHSVATDTWRFSVDFKDLQRQVKYLLMRRKPISAPDLLMHIRGEKVITEPSFLMTFDDGYKDILETKSFFKECGVKPALFVLADTEHADLEQLGSARPLLSNEDIKGLEADGWSIGCHSATHTDFTKLTPQTRSTEIVESKTRLEALLEFPIKYFAYPRGVYSSSIVESVKQAGYEMAFTMDEGFVNTGDTPTTVSRIGVDRTHSFAEFKTLATPLTLSLRQLVKKLISKKTVQRTNLTVEEYYKERFLIDSGISLEKTPAVSTASDLATLANNSAQSLFIDRLLNDTDEYENVIQNVHRVLKHGGTAFVTAASIVPISEGRRWGFTPTAGRYAFEKYFDSKRTAVRSYGNALAGRLLLNKRPASEVPQSKLDLNDPVFSVMLGITVTKD